MSSKLSAHDNAPERRISGGADFAGYFASLDNSFNAAKQLSTGGRRGGYKWAQEKEEAEYEAPEEAEKTYSEPVTEVFEPLGADEREEEEDYSGRYGRHEVPAYEGRHRHGGYKEESEPEEHMRREYEQEEEHEGYEGGDQDEEPEAEEGPPKRQVKRIIRKAMPKPAEDKPATTTPDKATDDKVRMRAAGGPAAAVPERSRDSLPSPPTGVDGAHH
jgi:hypothetical protein